MFKRLTKTRRHSADEIGCNVGVLPNQLTLDEPPGIIGRKNSQDGQMIRQQAAYAFATTRAKFSRKSCGDAYSLLASDEDNSSTTMQQQQQQQQQQQKQQTETDYRLVTAVPAFIVEHEPEKQKGLGVWGLRRMSKKIDSFRRSSSRETICTIPERPDNNNHNNNLNNNNNNKNHLDSANNNRDDKQTSTERKPSLERRFFQNSQRSPSPFKSFFIRMGSTGMLNSSSKNRRSSQNLEDKLNRTPEKENLFRSCSTSQLNTSPTYVKGDDPSEGIDLRITAKNEQGKTVSCDNLSGRRTTEDDSFDETLTSRTSFVPCDFTDNSRSDFMKKSSSCDFKETKKTNFPYAFLRSRLSVLPEERNSSTTCGKEDRLFKTASEEHFPVMKVEDTFEGTTTLGRRRTSKNGYMGRDSHRYRLQDPSNRYSRNSYSEETRYEPKDRYFGPVNMSMMHSGFDENCRNSISLPYQGSGCQDILSDYARPDTTNLDLSQESTASTTLLRNSSRRNSAPSGEQRLSSHYVSSNESGYDSDGPRGESAASEAEALSLKCTDSSDTSSVIDSELEKPMRSSTPEQENDTPTPEVTLEGLRWHQQTASGRLLPSIHQSSSPSTSPASSTSSSSSLKAADAIQASAHRVRLQQDKTRFLSDIIEPPKRIRRCRVVQLNKANPKESLGIRLAQQRIDEIRYVIVQLETDGIAHRDGRLRLGDEIVEVEGKDLRTLNSLEQVQDFLRSCEGTIICLKTVYEETMPQIYLNEDSSENDKYREASKLQKRPDYLPLESSSSTTTTTTNENSTSQHHHQYTTRHIARFEKGMGKPSLGFSVVGGRDSPRGEMGIFVRRVFPGGQADVSKSLFQGDEIITLNGKVLRGCTHQEVIELFKTVREGSIELELLRRHRYHKVPSKTVAY